MKYYAVATDTIRDEPFGLVVRNGSGSICYGFHAAGSEWANLYNDGEIKTLEEGLPPEVELGHFGQLHFDVEEMLEKSPETIPSPEMSVLVESEWLPNNSTGIGLTHVPLVKISKKSRQLAINYKAHAFLADSRHSSLLLKTRLSGGRLTPDDSHTRRTAKELLNTKMLILTQRYRNEDAVSEEEMQTKALGRQIGRGARRARRIGRAAGRSAMGFDPDARDADLDMLVQEGTAWERPALPGKPDLPGARSTRRTPADRDRAAMRQRQGGLASRRGSSMYASPRRGWSRAAGRDDAYGNIWLQPDDNPAREMDIERGIERFEKDILDQTVGQIYDEFEIRGLERIFEQFGDDDDERDRLIDETLIRDLPEELRNEVEGIAYNYAVDNPDAMLDYGADEGPDPYDEWRDRRDSGLASRRDPDGGMRSMREHIPGTRAWRNRREDREREERFDAQQERDRERWIEHTQGNGPPLAPAPDGYIRMPNGYRLLEDTDENRKLFGIEGRAMPPDPDPWDADRDTRPKRRAEHTPSTLEQLLAGTHRKLSKLRAGRGREEPDRDRPEERLDPRHHPEIKRPSSFRDRGFQQANRENPDFDRDNFSTFEKWQKAVHEEILRQDRLSDTGAGHRVEAKRPPLPPRDGGPRKRGERSQGRLVNPRARLGGGERYVRYGDLDENGDLPVDIPGKWVDAHGVDTIDPRKGEWSLHREGHTVRDPRSRGGGTGYLPRGEIRFTDPEWEDYRHALGPDNLPLMDTHLREVREDIRTNKALLEAVEAERVQLDADARHFVVQGRRSGKPKHRHSNDNGQPTNASLQRQAGLEFLTQSMSEDLPDIDRGRQAIVRGEQEWLDQQVTDSERRLQHLADQIVKDEKLLEVLEEHETYVERVDMPEPGSWVPSRVGEPNLTHRGQESDDDDMIDPTRIPLQMGEGMRSQRTDADAMLDILNAEPERLYAELRKVDDKQIIAWAKAAGIYDHRKNVTKLRRQLAGLPEPVPGNVDDELHFPGGRAEWEKRNRVPHLTPGWRSDGMLPGRGMRSRRDDQYGGRGAPGQKPQMHPNSVASGPGYGEPREREDGSWDPPSNYDTWADYDADWPYLDDDDRDVDTEGVVDERDEYPDDWGMRSRRGDGDDPPRLVRQVRSDGTFEDVAPNPDFNFDPDDGPESGYAQDPDNWRETQAEIRDMMDQRIEESLNRMTNEMRQEEFTRGTELEDAGRQALDDIEWAREMGFHSFINPDFDPARDPDPDMRHDDPFVRDQKLNESIFNDRMSPMTFDQVADKYDMDRVEVRRREMEHMNLLAGQERYNAQPNLNQRIYEDRVRHRMTLEEAAKKYDMDRAEVRMREVTHANSLSGQEKYDAQPNLNRRIAESRMRGMSLDEATERFNMDPDEVRSREVTYLGAVPEVIQAAQDAIDEPSYTGGFRSVRAPEREAPEAPEAPKVDQAKVNSLNTRIDSVRDQKIKPLFKRIAAAQEAGDDKTVHRLRKQVRSFQEEEAELREQLGEAMGKGRVSKFGYRSSRATDDWDADWASAREEAEKKIADLTEQIGVERSKKKPNKKKINELAQQQLAAIETARDRGLRAPADGAPWSDPQRSAARRAASRGFWSQGGEITDVERRSIGGGGLQSQREPDRARMRAATTQRAARPIGLASRRNREETNRTMATLPTIYRADSPRQTGTTDGEIWDSLTDDAGVMSPAHAKAIEDAAELLEVELMSGRTDQAKKPRGGSYDAGLAGGDAGKDWSYAEMFEDEVRKEMIRGGHIGKDDPTPPVTEWRLENIGNDETAGVRAFEQAFQVQLLASTGGVVDTRIKTKRKLLDNLQVLQQMRRSGNYEALEHLHPRARHRLMELAREKDQTFPKTVKNVTKTGGKKSSIWGAIAGHATEKEYEKHAGRRGRSRRGTGADKGPLRERIGTTIMAPGMPKAAMDRLKLRAQQAAAQAGGAGTGGAGPVKRVDPWQKKLSPLETLELKRAKKKTKKIGRLNLDERMARIRDNRTTGARDVDKPLGGAAATTYFEGTVDDLQQWEKVEGALVVDSAFIDRLARLTRVRRGQAKPGDAPKKRVKDSGGRLRQDLIDASWFHAGHSGLPELVGPEEIQDVVFEPDPDYPGRFKLREGFKPILRGLGRKTEKDKREGDIYWEQWVRLVSRFVGGDVGGGAEVHGAGENNAEPPVRVRLPDGSLTDPQSKGFMFGGYGSGALSFITPETRLIGWGKLAEINDEAESIVGVLNGAGLIDTEIPTSIKHDPDNFSIAVRAALDAAEKAGGGHLSVKGRADHREPRDPNAPEAILPTGSGFGIGGSNNTQIPMTASWRDTEFGSIIDQVLDLHDSGDLDPTQLEAAWDFLGKLPASVQKSGSREDHFLFDTLPIYGYDAVQRHGGVVSLSNRASVMVLDHPVTGEEVTEVIERLAKEGKLDQARLRELIPSYGSFH